MNARDQKNGFGFRHYRRCSWAILMLASAVIVTGLGCTKARVPASYTPPAAPQLLESSAVYHKEYILRPGDQIEVIVRNVPEVSRSVMIRPDGFISLPLFHDIHVAGLTIPELTANLTETFSKRLLNPEVSVIGTQLQPAMVYVVGEVGSAIAVPLRNATTAMQAITAAGGLRKTAAVNDISIIRLSEDGHLQAKLVGVTVSGQPGPYMGLQMAMLKPDDIIFVPENTRSQLNRNVQDFLNMPFGSINTITSTYLNFKLIESFK